MASLSTLDFYAPVPAKGRDRQRRDDPLDSSAALPALPQSGAAPVRKKTVIMIAHRLKTVEHADQILVVDHGRIVQRGTHEQLMAEEGIYKTFVGERREAASWKVNCSEASSHK